MEKNYADLLLTQLCEVASRAEEPHIDGLETRPVFILAPRSMLGVIYGNAIIQRLPQVVAVIDDMSSDARIGGVPRWSSAEFLDKRRQYPNALALDFACTLGAAAFFEQLCALAQIERVDCVVAQAQLGLVAVYESVSTYRQKTLDRLDDFLRIAQRFEDEHSRATLYANLLFRLTYDRSHMLPSWTQSEEEYFSNYAQPSTFRLGSREHYCDCGAFQGPIVRKFLAATKYRYESITAFEPDRANFKQLQNMSPLPLPRFRPLNQAVSDTSESLRFLETGTVSSHVSASGTVLVPTTRLDDELEKLTFLKMDVEGFEARTLQGAAHLIGTQRPRIAACAYHYAQDLLDIVDALGQSSDAYKLRLRQHNGSYYYDLVLYASPVAGVDAPDWAA